MIEGQVLPATEQDYLSAEREYMGARLLSFTRGKKKVEKLT